MEPLLASIVRSSATWDPHVRDPVLQLVPAASAASLRPDAGLAGDRAGRPGISTLSGGSDLLLDLPETPALARGYAEPSGSAPGRHGRVLRSRAAGGRGRPREPRSSDAQVRARAPRRRARRERLDAHREADDLLPLQPGRVRPGLHLLRHGI